MKGLFVCDGELRLLLHRMQVSELSSVCVPVLKNVSSSMRFLLAHEQVSQCLGFFDFSSHSRNFATTTGETFRSPFLLRSADETRTFDR
jgi:hypothetical protein